jgi:hypothetical protein
MFMIPGFVISFLTFPGVICHEIAHRFFCDITGVPVYAISYFQVGDPAGYVVHGPIKSLKSAFLISVGPLIINTILCSVLGFASVISLYILDVEGHSKIVHGVLLYLAISVGMHAFPSETDMDAYTAIIKSFGKRGLPYFFGNFLSGLFSLADGLRFVWFDAIYAFAIAWLIPWVILGI